jgi:hypothetical protein
MRKAYSLRTFLLGILLLAVIVPLAVLTFVHARTYQAQEREENSARLQEAAESIADSLLLRMSIAGHALEAQAQDLAAEHLAGKFDREQVEASLGRFRKVYNEFVTVILIDETGAVVAQHMDTELSRVPPYGRSVADRDYYQVPMQTGEIFVSDLFMGRNFGADPIIAISFPITARNGKRYVLEGSLKSISFSRFEDRYKNILSGRMVIADSKDQVIYASPLLNLQPLTSIAQTPLLSAARQSPISPFQTHGKEGAERVGHTVIKPFNWRVFVAQPVSHSEREIRAYNLFTIGLAIAGIILAVAVASVLSRAITGPIEGLAHSARALILEGKPIEVNTETFTPREVTALVEDVTAIGDRVSKVLTGLLPICSSCKSIRDQGGEWHRLESYIDRRTEAKFTHGMCPDCAEKLYPEVQLRKGPPPHKM